MYIDRFTNENTHIPDFDMHLTGSLLCEGEIRVIRPNRESFRKFSVNFRAVQA